MLSAHQPHSSSHGAVTLQSHNLWQEFPPGNECPAPHTPGGRQSWEWALLPNPPQISTHHFPSLPRQDKCHPPPALRAPWSTRKSVWKTPSINCKLKESSTFTIWLIFSSILNYRTLKQSRTVKQLEVDVCLSWVIFFFPLGKSSTFSLKTPQERVREQHNLKQGNLKSQILFSYPH